MLKHLNIRNLAIIDELELDFAAGFTTLTGETGAGKSILIDAIGLVIGTRADSALVRVGQEKAEISAEFSLSDSAEAHAWLGEQEMLDADDKNLCVIRRVVYAEGRTRAFVNGNAVNAGQLRELGETLIEIFGQSESQTLLRGDVQRRLLDDFGSYTNALEAVAKAARAHAEIERSIERIRNAGERDPAQIDYLRFQLRELEALNLQEGELEQLETDHKRLANAGKLIGDGGQALDLLYGGESSLYDQLSKVSSLLGALAPIDEGFNDALALSDAAQAQVRESADALRRVLDKLELDPDQLAQMERRLATVHELARKHRIKAAELPERLTSLKTELDELEHAATRLNELESQRDAALKTYRTAAQKLSNERTKAAKKFNDGVTTIVRQLGMANAQFIAAIENNAGDKPRAHGDDEIRFDFSANPGQPPRALAKVASGGELSRVSLAIQVVGSQNGGAATMIFDEVDAGIGGGTAEIVGQKLRALGSSRQVLCVTHLAQVAAQSANHFGIRKEIKTGQTFTRVRPLADKDRVEELARMQGGVEITAAALSHAKELLKNAAKV
ncbi:DNA repair protein RecN [Stenotrophobium rhamnosiphilum]|uniref:DNA repair protein RecN n=1 Tax=Stenotrophobium rhamnosiphilum TaxID=2029166 RepID=A0A2T5MHN5_9GAMM|nr:DNA repair protein RecN [Stenotrophobium rhamnosiphilum]PTU32092.1 DNA repair protein RecN [Stenotrophobium rhamnosiphilum]